MGERDRNPHDERHGHWPVAALLCATALLLFVPVVHGARATYEWANAPRTVEGLSVLWQQGRFDEDVLLTESYVLDLPNMPASHIAIYNDLRGPNNSITMREASPAAVASSAHSAARMPVRMA